MRLFLSAIVRYIDWKNDEAILFGKKIITKRKVAWYGDAEFSYTYSKVTKTANLWTSALKELKEIVEKESGETFNSCLLNLYHSGKEKEWHIIQIVKKCSRKMVQLLLFLWAQLVNFLSNTKKPNKE